MDIYKQICAKLVEAWDNTADGEYEDFGRAASYLVDWTRAELAELEGPTPQPADGEVAELVAWMRNQVTAHEVAQTQWAKRFVRAASLLERLSPPQPGMQPFVVRHYTEDERPTIKGNGFDGLEIGEDREEAEAFVTWINEKLARWGK